jgi:hypothetical protein
VKGNLAPRYIGPYEIIQVCGPVAYRIRLPKRFSALHNVFHVSQLRKCAHEPAREVIEEANAWIEPDLSVVEHPLRILDVKERKTRRQSVKMYKIQWSHHTVEGATGKLNIISMRIIRVFLNQGNISSFPYFIFEILISGRDFF